MNSIKLTKLTECAGCGAKVGAGELQALLGNLQVRKDPRLLVGFDKSDDASVYKISDELAIVQTVDFFPPIADDPYRFGAIAAANALSDVYAMGGEPKLALNIMMVPEDMDKTHVHEILRGGYAKVYEAGAMITGGHSIYDKEPKYGLAVTGFVHPDRILTNSGAKAGDVLVYTKPLGIGVLTTAAKAEMCDAALTERMEQVMMTLNRAARDVMVRHRVHACTDVTGFGMLGHMLEMASGSDVQIHVDLQAAQAQVIPEAWEFAEMGILPAGMYRNRHFAQDQVQVGEGTDRDGTDRDGVDYKVPLWSQEALGSTGGVAHKVPMRSQQWMQTMQDLLYDPQTSGGLLMAVDPEDAQQLLSDLKEAEKQPGNEGMKCVVIGTVNPYEGGKRILLI